MYIYKITNKVNNKCYIGKTAYPRNRFSAHCRSSYEVGRAIHKYGKENFSFDILFQCNWNDASLLESYLIYKFNSLVPNGYNSIYSYRNILSRLNYANTLIEAIRIGSYSLTNPYKVTKDLDDERPITCIEDYTEFNNALECALFYGLPSSTRVKEVCRGSRATAKGLTFRYLDENGSILEPKNGAKKKKREVYVEETDLIYKSVMDAIRDINPQMDKGVVNLNLNSKSENAYGFHFHYVIDDEIIPNTFVSPRKTKKVLMDNSIQFESVAEAIRELGLPDGARGAISQNIRGESSNAYGHTWAYIEDDDTISQRQFVSRKIDRSKVKRFEIICDNKYTFKSLAEACRYFNFNSNYAKVIAECCKGLRDEAFGHTWKYGKELTGSPQWKH